LTTCRRHLLGRLKFRSASVEFVAGQVDSMAASHPGTHPGTRRPISRARNQFH